MGCLPIIGGLVAVSGMGREQFVFSSGEIIKSAMDRRGFKHRRTEDQFTLRGEYARNLQFVYSRETPTRDGTVIDLVYFAADMLAEKLVIGLYRENPQIDNGVYINDSRSLALSKFTRENLDGELDKLIAPVRDRLK